jgi:hypothetical protein
MTEVHMKEDRDKLTGYMLEGMHYHDEFGKIIRVPSSAPNLPVTTFNSARTKRSQYNTTTKTDCKQKPTNAKDDRRSNKEMGW